MPYGCPTCKTATFDTEAAMMKHITTATCVPFYSEAQRQAAFAKVKNRRHWKGAINRVCEIKDDAEMELIADTIVYFTGSVPDIQPVQGERRFRVRAAGYWSAIGS